MALIGENQVRNILVLKDYPNHADIAAAQAGAVGDGFVLSAEGTAPAAGKEFLVGMKNEKKGITSFMVNPSRVTYGVATLGTPQVFKSISITDIGAVNAGELYKISIIIAGYGSLSVENEYLKHGFYKAMPGDVEENVIDGLIVSLARNFSRDEPRTNTTFDYTKAGGAVVKLPSNAWFTFSKTGTDTIVIAETNTWLEDYYVTGKKTNLSLDYKVDASFVDKPTITVTQAGALGKGTGYQVRNMEEYLLGNRQDTFRGAGYPHNFPESYLSDLSGNYNVIDIEYFDEGRDDGQIKSKKQLTICIPEAVGTFTKANLAIADVNTAVDGQNGVVIPVLA